MAYERILNRSGKNRGRNRKIIPIPQQNWRGVNYVDEIYTMPEHQLPYTENVDLGKPIGAITKVEGFESLFASLGEGKIHGLHAWKHPDGDKLIKAWDKNLYIMSGAAGSIAKSSQADWEAGIGVNLDTTTSAGDVTISKAGTDFSEVGTLTADFDGTHSNTVAASDSVILDSTITAYGMSSMAALSHQSAVTADLGWKFTVGASNITVEKLRIYSTYDGSITLRLWRVSDSAKLAEVTVTGVDGSWVEGSISPQTLTAGASYVVSAGFSNKGYHYNTGTSNAFDSSITFNEGVHGSLGSYPGTSDGDLVYGLVDIVISKTVYKTPGVYTHHTQDVSGVGVAKTATITYNKTTPAGTTLTVEVRISTDNGSTWGGWTAKNSGDTIIVAGTTTTNHLVQWRANLSATDLSATPSLDDFTVSVTTAYYDTASWISPACDQVNTPLTSVLSWTQTTPAGTTITWYARGSGNGTVFGDWREVAETGGAIPLSRYVQIKFVLTGTVTVRPSVSSLLISYSTSYTTDNLLHISPLGRTDDLLTGNRVRFQDYGDNCYCADGLRPFVLYVDDDTITADTAQQGTASTIRLEAGASAANDFYNNAFVTITGGTGEGQVRFISDYDGTTKDATVSTNWTTNPDATSTYSIGAAVKVRKAGIDPPATACTAADGGSTGITGTFLYKVTFVNRDDYEGNPSAASNSITVSNKTVALSSIPTGGATITQRKIYRTKTGGAVYYYVATIDDNTTTTYNDTTADASLTELMLDNNNIPPNASIVYAYLSYMFYCIDDEMWFSKAGEPEQVPNITGNRAVNVLPGDILDLKANPMALIPMGENFLCPITTNSGFIFDSDPAVDTTTMRQIDKHGSLSFEASDVCMDPQLRSILVFPTNTGIRTLLPGLQEESIETIPLSRNIQPYFDRSVNRQYMAAVFFNSYYIISMGDETFAYDFRHGEWYGPWMFGASCYAICGNVLYAGDPAVGKVYRMFTGSSFDGEKIKMIADLPMVSPGGENYNYKFLRFMAMVSANSDTTATVIKPKVDNREASISLGTLTDTFTGDVRPGHNNIRSRKYQIPLPKGNTLSYRIEDDSTNPVSIQKIITDAEVLPLKK